MPRKKEMPRNNERRANGRHSRKQNVREVRQRFLIVCEGKKTEPNYFKSFDVQTDVRVVGVGADPMHVVREAIAIKRDNKELYDQVWCVFDRDSFSADTFNGAIQLAKENNISVAYSNEAFELWYLLHFAYHNTAVSRQDYIKKLEKCLGRAYEKNCCTMYQACEKLQEQAIRNAERLLQEYEHPSPERDNPSTTVHLLVKELNQFLRGPQV